MNQALLETITIVVTSGIQSIFGVGVLLFGTPILLLIGCPFVRALALLLPVSFAISVLQVVTDRAHVDRAFLRRVVTLAAPAIVLSLAWAARAPVDMALLVGPFLLLVALRDVSPRLRGLLERLVRHERAYLVVTGLVHGLTNLGGSLLTGLVHGKQLDKTATRATIAAAYATFALFQGATLIASPRALEVTGARIVLNVLTGVTVFALTERLVYARLDDARYRRWFALFLAASALVLIRRALG